MKKALSVILSLILLFSVPVCAGAQEEYAQPQYPLIIIRGLQLDGLFTADEGSNERNCVVTPDTGEIISLVFKVLTHLITDRSLDMDSIIPFVNNIFSSLACDKNGDSVLDVHTDTYPEPIAYEPVLLEKIEAYPYAEQGIAKAALEVYGEKAYYFTYDWRLDQRVAAAQLNDMIESAKERFGAQKVDIVCCSMGGMVANFYLHEYGSDSVDSIVYDSSAFCGTFVTSELLSGQVLFTADTLRNMFSDMTGGSFFIKVLDRLGVFKLMANIAMKIVNAHKDEIYEQVLRDTFGTMPALWTLVQPDSYEQCVDYLFPTSEDKLEYASLISRTRELNAIAAECDEMLLSLPEKGVKVSVVASYGTQMVPVYPSAAYQSDGTLESALMLGRAVVSVNGETLGEDYAPSDPSKLSPDGCIDLSGALFPDSTWAIYGADHIIGDYGTDGADLIMRLLLCPEQPSVTDKDLYPQFLTLLEDGSFAAQ